MKENSKQLREKLESNDYAVGVQYMLHVRHLETHFIERFDPESNFVICLPDKNFVYLVLARNIGQKLWNFKKTK